MSTVVDHAVILQVLETLGGPLEHHGNWEYYPESEGQSAKFVWGTYAYLSLEAEDVIKAVEEGDGIASMLKVTLVDLADMLTTIADEIYAYASPDLLEPPPDD